MLQAVAHLPYHGWQETRYHARALIYVSHCYGEGTQKVALVAGAGVYKTGRLRQGNELRNVSQDFGYRN